MPCCWTSWPCSSSTAATRSSNRRTWNWPSLRIAAAFDRCIERGARLVVIHPYFLLARPALEARHPRPGRRSRPKASRRPLPGHRPAGPASADGRDHVAADRILPVPPPRRRGPLRRLQRTRHLPIGCAVTCHPVSVAQAVRRLPATDPQPRPVRQIVSRIPATAMFRQAIDAQNPAVCTPFRFRSWLAGSERGAYTEVQGHSMDLLGTFPEFANDELSISRHDSAVG